MLEEVRDELVMKRDMDSKAKLRFVNELYDTYLKSFPELTNYETSNRTLREKDASTAEKLDALMELLHLQNVG